MKIPIEIIVAILGFVFTVLSVMVGIMFKALNKNTEAIERINLTLAKQETSSAYEVKECVQQHEYIKKKFAEHGSKIENHEKRLITLEK